ncbi:LamG-like jellyroll fold domain-containing protein [Promicromonospora sp. NPDC057488]|uniref:LamG-like jellyroll fold domain-containing protein n=1 Tax=Promicromonospora sp. NPDC057488 TaxID=3346147 RepID=UPI003672E9D8
MLPVDGPVECVDVLTDPDVDPVQVASVCGHDVEIAEARTPWDTYFVQPNGQVRWVSTATASRTRVNETWEPASGEIVTDPAEPGGLTVAAGVFDIDLGPAGPGEPFAELSDPSGTAGDLGWDNEPGQAPTPPAGDRKVSISLPTLPFRVGEPVLDPDNALRAEFPLVRPDGATIPGAAVVVTVEDDGTGLIPVLRIDDLDTYEVLEQASGGAGLSFAYEVSDDLRVETAEPVDAGDGTELESGEFQVVDVTTPVPGGEPDVTVFSGGRAQQWDSSAGVPGAADAESLARTSADADDGDTVSVDRHVAPVDGDQVTDMDVEIAADGRSVVATADDAMFADPEATGPFYIDPQIKGGLHEWTAVRSGWPTSSSSYKYSDSEGVGLCPTWGYPICDRTSVSRLLFEFSMSGLPAGVSGSDVSGATFSALGTHSYTCNKYGVDLYQTAENGVSSATTWDSRGNWQDYRFQSQKSVTHRAGCTGRSSRVSWGAKAAAVSVANGDWDYVTLGLRAVDEGNQDKWQRYVASTLNGSSHKAQFTVTFNRPPYMPSTASMKTTVSTTGDELECSRSSSSPTDVRTRQPYFQAAGVDPEGESPWNQSVELKFRVIDHIAGTVRWESGWTGLRASPTTHRVRVPETKQLSNQRTYRWQAAARDSSGKSTGWSEANCYIRPDLTGPNAPEVKSAQYPAWPAGVAGGVSQPGTFTFSANGSTDLKLYKYSFNDGQQAASITTSGGTSKSVSFAPIRAGKNEVEVQSQDMAGIWSPPETYEFWVGYPARDGLWHLDEGTGTTSLNEVTTPPTAGHLTWSTGVSWGAGALRETLADPNGPDDPRFVNDKALVFDGTGIARTSGPAVAIDKSYTVMAFLKPAADFSGSGAAISQEGDNRGAFHLGYTDSADCGTETDETDHQLPCWGLWVKDADTTDAGHAAARSDVPAVAGQWMHVVGTYDASDPAHPTLSVRVCDPSAPFETPEPVTVEVDPVAWTAPGPMRLGSGVRAGVPEWPFRGAVDDVRVYRELVDAERLDRICWGADAS